MKKNEFEYITPIDDDDRKIILAFHSQFENKRLAEALLKEFLDSGLEHVKVKDEVTMKFSKLASCSRCIGGAISRLKVRGKVQVFSSVGNVYLVKIQEDRSIAPMG